jgi:hypothetical protein
LQFLSGSGQQGSGSVHSFKAGIQVKANFVPRDIHAHVLPLVRGLLRDGGNSSPSFSARRARDLSSNSQRSTSSSSAQRAIQSRYGSLERNKMDLDMLMSAPDIKADIGKVQKKALTR